MLERVLFVLAVVVSAAVVSAAEHPIAVSPGDVSKLASVEGRCPTFSWGAVTGAKSYELVVYLVGQEGEEAKSVLKETLVGSASSWTPSLDRCLERGGRYAWSVRAVERKGASEWSPPSLFKVAEGPSEIEFEEAVAVVQRYVAEQATESAGASASSGVQGVDSSPSALGVNGGPPSRAALAGDSDLQVNGSSVVTTATFGAGVCEAINYRYIDLGDGTVLDCNTGKQWLQDASCLGSWPFKDAPNPNIFDRVTDLNGGTDFGCADYAAGTYSDWEVPAKEDLCGLWDGTCAGVLCCTASAGIVDTSVGVSPTVANAAGDGQWAEGDVFVGVQSTWYWSRQQVAGVCSGVDQGDAVNLANGSVACQAKDIGHPVWAVRAVP